MAAHRIRGAHVFMDYTEAFFEVNDPHEWVLSIMRAAVAQSSATEVHSHAVSFDGSTFLQGSPRWY